MTKGLFWGMAIPLALTSTISHSPLLTTEPSFHPLMESNTTLETGSLYHRQLPTTIAESYKELKDSVEELQEMIEVSADTLTNITNHQSFQYEFGKPVVFELTAYTLMPEENGWFGTISSAQYELEGKYLKDRYIAVDPRVIPYHSKVYIEFPEHRRYVRQHGELIDLNGEYLAVDCGGAIQKNKIDLFVGGQTQYYEDIANQIGRGDVNVYFPVQEK